MYKSKNLNRLWNKKSARKLQQDEEQVFCPTCNGEDFVQFSDTDHYICTNCHTVIKVNVDGSD